MSALFYLAICSLPSYLTMRSPQNQDAPDDESGPTHVNAWSNPPVKGSTPRAQNKQTTAMPLAMESEAHQVSAQASSQVEAALDTANKTNSLAILQNYTHSPQDTRPFPSAEPIERQPAGFLDFNFPLLFDNDDELNLAGLNEADPFNWLTFSNYEDGQ